MKRAKRVLVGLKEKGNAIELTDAACRLAAPGAQLLLVHVVEVPDATPLDANLPELEANAQEIVAAAARVARRSGRDFRTLILWARGAGRALLETMKEEKVELAVLGSHHGRSVGELFFGTTHQFLAKHAPCQILLSIPPRRREKSVRAA